VCGAAFSRAAHSLHLLDAQRVRPLAPFPDHLLQILAFALQLPAPARFSWKERDR
jgi:hypothetical protein